jgi:hypothetical protein
VTTIDVPARAKVYACQYVVHNPTTLPADPQAVFWGQAYHAMVIKAVGSGALTTWIPSDATTHSNVALWDPAAEGQSVARAGTETPWFPQSPSPPQTDRLGWVWNVAYTWDLAAIEAAYGALPSAATVRFTILNAIKETTFSSQPGPLTPLMLMWGRRLREPEHDAAPSGTGTYAGETLYYPSSNAWRDPGSTTATTPDAWAASDADVASPSSYFPGWSTLMDYGNGVPGQVPMIPKLPVAPLGGTYLDPGITDPFQLIGSVPSTVGDVTVSVDPAADAYAGRWLMLWVGFENDQVAVYGGDYSGGRNYGFADLSLTATLSFDGGRAYAPPLWQRQRIGVLDSPEQWTSGLVSPQSSPWQGGTL